MMEFTQFRGDFNQNKISQIFFKKMIIDDKKIINDIINYWKEKRPEIIGPIHYCRFYKHSAISCVEDFLDNNERNIETYPWVRKIFQKRKEIFGF